MPTKLTRQNLAKHVTISLHAEHDPERPDFDDADLCLIQEQIAAGNMWAWCVVTVTATLDDPLTNGNREEHEDNLHGIAVLGGCSYESRKAFEDSNLADMTSGALDDLWAQLEARTPAGRAKALANGSRQAITTSFRGPTDSHDARVIARCEAKRIAVRWDDHLDQAGNHAAAAIELMDQLGWSERDDLVMGGTREGYVFVRVPKRTEYKGPRVGSEPVDYAPRNAHFWSK